MLGPTPSFWRRHSSSQPAPGVGVDVRLPDAVEHDLEDRVVEVVAAQARHAGGGDDLVDAPGHVDQRRVEGAPAEVVDEHVLAAAGDRAAEAVRVLEPGGGGLVEQGEDLEAGAAEGLQGQEALVVGGVGGHAHRDLERLSRGRRRRSSGSRCRRGAARGRRRARRGGAASARRSRSRVSGPASARRRLIERTTVQSGSSTTCSASWPSRSAPSDSRTATSEGTASPQS